MKEDWIEVELGEICNFIGGGTPSKKEADFWNGDIPWASIKDIKGDFLKKTQDFITEKGLNNSSANLAMCNEIIIGTRINPGKPIISKIKTAINQDLKVVKPQIKIDTKFLFYNFKNSEKNILKISSGTTVLGINLNNLRGIKIPLAPLPEQRAIVAKIEQLFSELDKGIQNLKTAQEQLKVYRQAVLKKAFEGELTKEWRKQQINLPSADTLLKQIKEEREKHYQQQIKEWEKVVKEWEKSGKEGKKPGKPKKASNLDLKIKLLEDILEEITIPDSWCIVPLVFITGNKPDSIVDGPFGSAINVSQDYKEEGVPVVRMVNIRPFRYVSENLKFIIEDKFMQLRRHNIISGDVLIAKVGATIGDCCIYPKNQPEAMLSTTGSCRLRLDYKYYTNNLLEYFISYQKHTLKGIASQTAQPFLNMKVLKSYPIVLMSIQEQHQIVQEIESRLSVCDKVEESIKESLQKAEALRQSILKKAFEGKLLNQQELEACRKEKGWEPASVLLEKIKAEKEVKTHDRTHHQKKSNKNGK